MAELAYLGIAESARLLAARDLSPVELTEALLARIGAYDSQVNSFITVTAELALKQAQEAESEIASGRYRGAMHGIPFGVKDNYNTAGVLTSAHSRVCRDNVPREDATAVARLYRAGAVLLGKLATYEFAHGGPAMDLPWPPARNPWHLEHVTGGSSSGRAASVAAGFLPGAFGTDTGGSIRGPASLCGVTGLKPTYGLVSRYGVMPSSYTFDACGPLTRGVEDCAILLEAIAGHDPKDPASARHPVPNYRAGLTRDIRGLRVGVVRHFWEDDLPADDDVRQAMDAALAVLAGLGARIETMRMRPLKDSYDVSKTIALPELMCIHRTDLSERAHAYSADFRGTTLAACVFQAVDYVEAQRERTRMLQEMQPLYERHDVFVTAASPAPAPRLDSYRTLGYWQRPNITRPFSITGGPALAVCNGYSRSGLPLGMQIAGRPFAEETVLRVGHAYEQATDWRDRRPALVPDVQPARLA